MKKSVVLWTGGKDSCLALHKAWENKQTVKALITFVPKLNDNTFKAHPIHWIERQAKSLALEHRFIKIKKPYLESYKQALEQLVESYELDLIVTGDIDYVDGHPNWINECCKDLCVDTFFPLWKKEREWLLLQLETEQIEAIISYINHPAIPKNWIGRKIDKELREKLCDLYKGFEIDPAGEKGEYHTMVVRSPYFQYSVHDKQKRIP